MRSEREDGGEYERGDLHVDRGLLLELAGMCVVFTKGKNQKPKSRLWLL